MVAGRKPGTEGPTVRPYFWPAAVRGLWRDLIKTHGHGSTPVPPGNTKPHQNRLKWLVNAPTPKWYQGFLTHSHMASPQPLRATDRFRAASTTWPRAAWSSWGGPRCRRRSWPPASSCRPPWPARSPSARQEGWGWGSKPMASHLGVGALPILVYFSGVGFSTFAL